MSHAPDRARCGPETGAGRNWLLLGRSAGLRPHYPIPAKRSAFRGIADRRRLRNGSDRIHHALDDGWLDDGADLKGRGKTIVERTLNHPIPVEHGRGADSCGSAAETPPQRIHFVRGCQRCVARRLVVDNRFSPPALNRILLLWRLDILLRRLEAASVIFAHRRKPALNPLMIGRLHGPGCPGARIFLPNGLCRW